MGANIAWHVPEHRAVMVYFILPFIGAAGAAAAGVGVARLFNVTENATARALHGSSGTPYPWPPVSLGESQPTNTSTVGLIAAAAVFAVSFRLQGRTVWNRIGGIKIEGAPVKKIENVGEFLKASGPETAAWCANVISSSLVAAIVKPMVDGKGTK